jgi:putative photosynthetic complex assembly protein 2
VSSYLLAVVVALFSWWFSTGVILMLNHLPRSTYSRSFMAATLVLLGSLACLPATAQDISTTGAVTGFVLALLIWGWLEMGYLMGIVTGPRGAPCPSGASTQERFVLAVATSLYHELAVVLLAGCVLALTWQAPNQVATATFVTLWLMRWSAKLNLFLGVRNYNGHWLPVHLRYLDSYIRRRRMNALFPISVLLGVAATAGFYHGALTSGTEFSAVGNTLVGSLVALAVLEHAFLMLPLGDAALWRWALPGSGDKQERFPTGRAGGGGGTAGDGVPAQPQL